MRIEVMPSVDYKNLISDTESNDDLERIYDQVQREAEAWTIDYHLAGKRGGELSESDLTIAVARRWAQHCIACRS